LLSAPLSPCRRYHPAGGVRRFSWFAPNPAVFASDPEARPPELLISRLPHVRFRYSLVTRNHPSMALSVGFRVLVSLHPATQATGFRPLPRWDCLPLSVPAFPGRAGLLSVHFMLRPACSPSRLSDPLHRRLRRLRFLYRRSDCFRVERIQFPGGTLTRSRPAPFHGARAMEMFQQLTSIQIAFVTAPLLMRMLDRSRSR
jgi:hypothetical protein